jgi:hypothetical protein
MELAQLFVMVQWIFAAAAVVIASYTFFANKYAEGLGQ